MMKVRKKERKEKKRKIKHVFCFPFLFFFLGGGVLGLSLAKTQKNQGPPKHYKIRLWVC